MVWLMVPGPSGVDGLNAGTNSHRSYSVLTSYISVPHAAAAVSELGVETASEGPAGK